MISRRSILIGGGATFALATGGGIISLSSLGSEIRAPLLYAFPLHEFAKRMQILSYQTPADGLVDKSVVLSQYPDWNGEALINREIHVPDLADASSRSVTTPNNDTLYTSAVLDLSVGPIEVVAPDSRTRYLSIAFMDPFNDQVAYIGTRATGGRGGRYWIIGPGHSPIVPQNVTPIPVKANDLWMLGRVFVKGEDDLDEARAFQSQISARQVEPGRPGRHFLIKPEAQPDASTFLALTNEVLARNPDTVHAKRASQFEKFGILPGKLDAFESLSRTKRYVWSRAVDQIDRRISDEIALTEENTAGWTSPPQILGNYGTNDEVRAGTAKTGFGALTVEEAVYFSCTRDASGTRLDGSKAYKMIIPAEGVPTAAFWSISMYALSSDGRFYFYENELGRYAMNSHDGGLIEQADGSIVFAFQHQRPSDPGSVWLPTPNGEFKCVFRTYLPHREIREGGWVPPPIVSNA